MSQGQSVTKCELHRVFNGTPARIFPPKVYESQSKKIRPVLLTAKGPL